MKHTHRSSFWCLAVIVLIGASLGIARGLEDGLGVYYSFDGDAADASGNERHGTELGGVLYAPGKIGEAVRLNGRDASILGPAVNTPGSVTVSAWLMTGTNNPIQTAVAERAANGGDMCGPNSAATYLLGIYPVHTAGTDEGHFAFSASTISDGTCSQPRIIAPRKVTAGRFYCVTGVYDQARRSQELYVDGRRVAELESVGDVLRTEHDAVLRVGMNSPMVPQRWDGLIDDLRIYERALTGDEVEVLCGLSVVIDLKPEDPSNTVNEGSLGTVPVAILSTESFDAPGTTDAASLRLGGAAVNATGKNSRVQCAAEDANGDERSDLVCHFITADIVIEPGASVVVLKGQTLDGVALRGQDSIRIVPQPVR